MFPSKWIVPSWNFTSLITNLYFLINLKLLFLGRHSFQNLTCNYIVYIFKFWRAVDEKIHLLCFFATYITQLKNGFIFTDITNIPYGQYFHKPLSLVPSYDNANAYVHNIYGQTNIFLKTTFVFTKKANMDFWMNCRNIFWPITIVRLHKHIW